MKTMINEEQFMESINYINNLASSIVADEAEQAVAIKLDEQGFNSLTEEEVNTLTKYLEATTTITYTAEFMRHTVIVSQMYDPTIAVKCKDIDWTIIEKPFKNRNEMSEFEAAKALKELQIFEGLGKLTIPSTEVGYDETGRPYAKHIMGDMDITLYLDTKQYVLKAI